MTLHLRPGGAPSSKKKARADINDAKPSMETVRITGPDLDQRAALERARGRMVVGAFMFICLFS
ncbi:MAG: hypothetical protein KGH75_09615, partial [Rhodospirillales bacterium]|nr:hypothetical protein [Rhodospirillales bacterium]